jgi:hypothetical protein
MYFELCNEMLGDHVTKSHIFNGKSHETCVDLLMDHTTAKKPFYFLILFFFAFLMYF